MGAFASGRFARQSLFLIYVTGALLTVDAAFFAGQYRTEVWTTVREGTMDHGRRFNLDVQNWLRKALW